MVLPAHYSSRSPAMSGVCLEFEVQGIKPNI